jgi:preprotein translocase subunit SecA
LVLSISAQSGGVSMVMRLLAALFGTKNERELKSLAPRVAAINALEPRIKALTDDGIALRTAEIRQELQRAMQAAAARKPAGTTLTKEDVNEVMDSHLHETFALVREASRRVMGMRHYDVQLIGGMTLHLGRVAEMKTGEGKTLVGTCPAVLNALTGNSVHVVTVNDYLATRDAEWMGRIYRFMGLSVGVVVPHQPEGQKREAYQADITYGQNNEFGFDYLRDNMKFALKDYMQRGHGFAIVDEVDSILIDEARTPLIISGQADENLIGYVEANGIVPMLRKDEHYTIDEKSSQVILTEAGVSRSEQLFSVENLYQPQNIEKLHRLTQGLKAHTLFKRDKDYVIEKGEVVIVDEHTGRLMYGRRWSDGLHGAIEAKENVRVQPETRTLATVSFQNYFRMYRKLAGMTGTADTEAEEFSKIYNLDVILIPTNRSIQRKDDQDLIYKTEREKFEAVAEDITSAHGRGQPVLVGTVSVEKSEVLSNLLKRKSVPHQVLNAKKHKDEAAIIAQAGQAGAVTIATNMAGRGTDILLGGNAEYMARQEVALAIGGTEQQVAEFAFLTGRADLINVDRLAERDSKDGRFMAPIEQRTDEWNEAVKLAEANGEDIRANRPNNIPGTFEEARAMVVEERRAFYVRCVDLYRDALPRMEAVCDKAKENVRSLGGLRIVGTERHESRRIDNQLRGRAGRQGDPGSSRFYMSLQDDLMRIFGGDRMIRMMEMLGMKDGEPIEHSMVTKSIADAQKRVEGMHFDSRKNLIEYDDVMNQQRKAVYTLRRTVLEAMDSNNVSARRKVREMVLDLAENAVIALAQEHAPDKTSAGEWKVAAIVEGMRETFGVDVSLNGCRDRDELLDRCWKAVDAAYLSKEANATPDVMRQIEAFLYLQVIDEAWKQHLSTMEQLREGIHLRSYGQKDPKQEYKKEGYNIFVQMMARIRDETLDKIMKAQIVHPEEGVAELERLKAERAARRAGSAQANKRVNSRSAMPPSPAVPTATRPTVSMRASSGVMAGPAAGSASVAGGPSPSVTSTAGANTMSASSTTGAPARAIPASSRQALREELAAAVETDGDGNDEAGNDEAGGMNRAQRRRVESQKRKQRPAR